MTDAIDPKWGLLDPALAIAEANAAFAASSGGSLLHASVTLTPSQIKALAGTPVTIVTGVVGKTIILQQVVLSMTFATTPYGGSDAYFGVYFADNIAADTYIETFGGLVSGVSHNQLAQVVPGNSYGQLEVGQSVVVGNASSDMTSGNSPITIDVWYALK